MLRMQLSCQAFHCMVLLDVVFQRTGVIDPDRTLDPSLVDLGATVFEMTFNLVTLLSLVA